MNQGAAWDELIGQLRSLQRRIVKSTATNVAATNLRNEAKGLVQLYFRRVRGELESLGLTDFDSIDKEFQTLLVLANRVSRRSTYVRLLKAIQVALQDTEGRRELAIGASLTQKSGPSTLLADHERRIIQTLETLVPSAALSYRQATLDLVTPGRISFRGTAAELREALREVLDHLAPDAAVSAVAGFKLEADQTLPTMRQKVRFILRSRGQPRTAITTAEKAAELVDELVATLVRSVYNRASVSTHIAPSVEEVKRVKSYVDTILIDLLEA